MSEVNNIIVRGNKAQMLLTLDAVDKEGQPIEYEIDPSEWTVRVQSRYLRMSIPITEVEGNTITCVIAANELSSGNYSVEAYSSDNRFAARNAFKVVDYSEDALMPAGVEIEEEVAPVTITMMLSAAGG